ncbi:armadillo-type protein [Irpex rosettiformis]|uniref:Armadillo-type protein n=1 Tax=Irpex rosettiformis TaxID=378272 RepID=A0ACB8UEA3_9APHY|nr:armadillo-type protein [Irpex rosettiformis]
MPREHRKRGKKHKKQVEEVNAEVAALHRNSAPNEAQNTEAGPSWIVSRPSSSEFNAEAPFGYVDSEVKAYFRTVDTQIREWQDGGHNVTEDGDTDPNDNRRMFFAAALTEMSGKEKELSTDPDCSNILERMAYSMDDFARRVFLDRLTGSYKTLIRHRFASHVCQTFFEVTSDTIARECRNIIPSTPESADEGELLLMKDLILDASEELLPDLPSLAMDPFASHVLRALLATLVPTLFHSDHKSSIRSRRSAAHKARQGPRSSVFVPEVRKEAAPTSNLVIPEYKTQARKFVIKLGDALGGNEVRALAASQVASPLLQMLLEIEADQNMALSPDSLSDRVLDGLITQILNNDSEEYLASDYVGTLLRDPTSSHLLETLVARLPDNVFEVVWKTYFKGKLSRLAVHPVANFVVAKCLGRASGEQLRQASKEIEGVSDKIYKSSRTGVFRALVERAGTLGAGEAAVLKTILSAASIDAGEPDGVKAFVPCLLRVIVVQEYQKLLETQSINVQKPVPDSRPGWRGHVEALEDPQAVKTQGAILLQAILKLSSPHNQLVLDSIFAQSTDDLIAIAHDVTSSRVLDVILTSLSVPFKEKRRFVMQFIGHYHILVDDRIGSRVGDNCWAFADPYLREKIARSLFSQESTLAGSFYGKFFARNLNLHLLKKDPEQWKAAQTKSRAAVSAQIEQRAHPIQPPPAKSPPSLVASNPSTSLEAKKRSKRKHRAEDEIDKLFKEKLGKKVKKAALEQVTFSDDAEEDKGDNTSTKKRKKGEADGQRDDLQEVLGAVKAAPKGEGNHRAKKKK